MAVPGSRKRRYNVRSNSSSSSLDSIENSVEVETGYGSDNSTSESDVLDSISETGKTGFKTPVVRKEFTLLCSQGKRSKIDVGNSERTGRQPKCFSKNAINARLNRIKKKKHMEDMEKTLTTLSDENAKLKEAEEKKDNTIKKLQSEVQYLRAVLANSKEIGMLIRCVKSSGLPIASSLCEKPVNICPPVQEPTLLSSENNSVLNPLSSLRESDIDLQDPFLPCSDPDLLPNELFEQNGHCDSLQPFFDLDLQHGGGICLHVAQENISVEFCAECNANAISALKKKP